MMKAKLKVLMLDNEPADAALVAQALAGSFVVSLDRVETREAFIRSLEQGEPDVILSDGGTTGFTGLSAVAVARKMYPETPFILVSATMCAEDAVALLKAGANDYVHKSRLPHLATVLQRSLNLVEHRARRRRTEAALKESQERLGRVARATREAVLTVDAQQLVVGFDAAAEQLFGCTAADALGSSLDRFIPAFFPTAYPPSRPHLKPGGAGDGLQDTLRAVRVDGHEFPIEASITQTDTGGRRLFTVGLRDVTKQRRAEAALKQMYAELANRTAGLEKLVEQRTASLEAMVAELRHFSYAMIHDLRGPLRAMNAFATLMLEEVEAAAAPSPSLQDYCQRIIAGANRLDHLIQDSLNYTKTVLEEVSLRPVDLGKLVAGLLATYPDLQPGRAAITIETPLPVVLGEEGLLTQCFANLLDNAAKFVAPGVHPRIRIRATNVGEKVRIDVEDNGIGIPAQAQPRLFGMFERLADGYEGTGMGLAIVRKVVERMGGRLGVESEPDRGSRFWVELRLAPPATAPAP